METADRFRRSVLPRSLHEGIYFEISASAGRRGGPPTKGPDINPKTQENRCQIKDFSHVGSSATQQMTSIKMLLEKPVRKEMIPDYSTFSEAPLLGAIAALKPMSYVMRLGFAVLAFGAAMNVDKVIARVIGFVWLLVIRVRLRLRCLILQGIGGLVCRV